MGFKKLSFEENKGVKNTNKRRAKLDAYKKTKNNKEWK